MPLYESVFIARQDLSNAQIDALTEKYSNLITEQKGKILKTEYWGLRNLAYTIKKNKKGHYVMFNIEIDPKSLAEYERQLRINEDILRFLTIKIDEVNQNPSAMMQERTYFEQKAAQRAREAEEAAETSESAASNDSIEENEDLAQEA